MVSLQFYIFSGLLYAYDRWAHFFEIVSEISNLVSETIFMVSAFMSGIVGIILGVGMLFVAWLVSWRESHNFKTYAFVFCGSFEQVNFDTVFQV